MRVCMRVVLVAALLSMSAGAVQAGQGYGIRSEPPQKRERRPGPAIGAAASNIVFAPVRIAVTIIGAGLGGLTGFLTAGNVDAASDIWALFDGQNYLSPEVMTGEEQLRFGTLEAQ